MADCIFFCKDTTFFAYVKIKYYLCSEICEDARLVYLVHQALK